MTPDFLTRVPLKMEPYPAEDLARAWQKVAEACRAHNCRKPMPWAKCYSAAK